MITTETLYTHGNGILTVYTEGEVIKDYFYTDEQELQQLIDDLFETFKCD